ncbi:hypothetical protein ACFY19_03835 [Streptosporangium saharense]|uniref:hypothetical protein n=1 Tax=Streptosporangium saharense TaxID=1706840 RepID=UPI00368945AA
MDDDIIAGGNCGSNDCPTVFRTSRPGFVAVQGYTIRTIRTPDGESAVEVPEALIREAARALGE